MKIPANRKGFIIKKTEVVKPVYEQFERPDTTQLVYWQSKLTHNGIVSFKSFENYNRRLKASSLANLLNHNCFTNYVLDELVKDFRLAKTDDKRSNVNDQACELLDKSEFELYLRLTRQARCLNPLQSRKLKSMCNKLTYYSQTRHFESKKSGKHQMKVAFLTLTAPDSAEPEQLLKAFNSFLDYLQRTANCVYVWKKELGEKSGHLHFHVLINNFIPYYIIAWKWKRLLIAQNVHWPSNADGVESNSHSRIELPRSKKLVAHYIAKYMSKAYDLPGNYGYLSGHSSVLNKLKEPNYIDNDLPIDEINALIRSHKTIRAEYVSIICTDLMKVQSIAPCIGSLFEEQYLSFSERITLPQKFHYV